MGGRRHGGVLPRRANSLYRAEGADTENLRAASASCPSHRGEEGQERSSVAAGLSEHAATSSAPGDGSADRWNAHLRFALTTGLRFSAHSNDNINRKKGTFYKLTMGTFLISLDTAKSKWLTSTLPGGTLLTELLSAHLMRRSTICERDAEAAIPRSSFTTSNEL